MSTSSDASPADWASVGWGPKKEAPGFAQHQMERRGNPPRKCESCDGGRVRWVPYEEIVKGVKEFEKKVTTEFKFNESYVGTSIEHKGFETQYKIFVFNDDSSIYPSRHTLMSDFSFLYFVST